MMLSILIPIYNDVCCQLVRELHAQAERDVDSYEIIVADDGSTNLAAVEENKKINSLSNCLYIINKENRGRAGIRNFLADQAKGDWLLFIDGDLHAHRSAFLRIYTHFISEHNCELCSVYGGYEIPVDDVAHRGNLRYAYEKSRSSLLDVKHRQANADKDFKTSNVMMSRAVFEQVRFDDSMRTYGYEDTLFGQQLARRGIPVYQIDNPVLFDDFEDNNSFLRKSEDAIANVVRHENMLQGYSRLLQQVCRLQQWHMRLPLMWLWQLLHKPLRRNLTGGKPSIFLFNIYKLLLTNKLRQ